MTRPLTPTEAKIIVACQLHADDPVTAICRAAKVPVASGQHAIRKLTERGIIRRGALLDLSRIGWEQWLVYVAFASSRGDPRRRAVEWLGRHPRVAWYGEVGGEFHLGFAMYARSSEEVARFSTELTLAHGGSYRRKAIARATVFTSFTKNYLAESTKSKREWVEVREGDERIEIDKKDFDILAALFTPEAGSRPAIARGVELPRSTVEYRIQRLKERGLLIREVFFVSAPRIGMLLYRLLITLRGLVPANSAQIHSFAVAEPEVVSITKSLGAWDFELALEVSNPRRAIELADRFSDRFENEIADAVVVPVFTQGTSRNFLSF